MSRILFVSAAIAPSAALAHVGSNDLGASGTLIHSISYADHLLPFIAALMLPVAATVLTWKRST